LFALSNANEASHETRLELAVFAEPNDFDFAHGLVFRKRQTGVSRQGATSFRPGYNYGGGMKYRGFCLGTDLLLKQIYGG
jgi:hypothetical protein